jgi:hypothetical protein
MKSAADPASAAMLRTWQYSRAERQLVGRAPHQKHRRRGGAFAEPTSRGPYEYVQSVLVTRQHPGNSAARRHRLSRADAPLRRGVVIYAVPRTWRHLLNWVSTCSR